MSARPVYPKWTVLTWALIVPTALIVAGGILIATTDLADMPFDNLDLWWLVAIIPVASLLVLYGFAMRRRALERFTSPLLTPLLSPAMSPSRLAARNGLFLLAMLMLFAALLGPRWGIYLEKQEVRGIDIVTVLDVSRSMLARDLEPNRIERAKEEIRQQLTERAAFQGANRLALTVFAGSSVTRLPLTTDHLAFRRKLEEIGVGIAGRGGTDIGRAIEEAADLFAKSPESASKIILLFTDGEDHEGAGMEAARRVYADQAIRTFAIGVGDPRSTTGAEVPADASGSKPLLYEGQIVFSRLDTDGLRKLAEAGNGRFASIDQLSRVIDAIAGLRQTELTTEERMRHRPRYQWFLVAALVLLGAEMLIGERRAVPAVQAKRVWQEAVGT